MNRTQSTAFPEGNVGALRLCQAQGDMAHPETPEPCRRQQLHTHMQINPGRKQHGQTADSRAPRLSRGRMIPQHWTLHLTLETPPSSCSLTPPHPAGHPPTTEGCFRPGGTHTGAAPHPLRLAQVVTSPLPFLKGLVCSRVYSPQALCPFSIDHKKLLFAVVRRNFFFKFIYFR